MDEQAEEEVKLEAFREDSENGSIKAAEDLTDSLRVEEALKINADHLSAKGLKLLTKFRARGSVGSEW